MLRILSLSDTITTCDCCGRTNLKKTVILTESDSRFVGDDEVKAYGSQCAATALRNAKVKGYRDYVSTAAINKSARSVQQSLESEVANLTDKGGLEWAKANNRYLG